MSAASSPYGSRITGTGSAFPDGVLTNRELASRLSKDGSQPPVTEDWIYNLTGIRERRISRPGDPAEFNSALGMRAARRAREMAGKRPEEIAQIIYATCTPDTLIPSTACWVQHKLGAKRAWAMDINAACSGFVYALATADQFVRSGQVRTSLVIGADVLSTMTDWEDRHTCILFADGAGAAVVERTERTSSNRILSSHLGSDGSEWDLFHIPAGGSNQEVTPETHARRLDKMRMKGHDIFKVAVRTLSEYGALALQENDLEASDLKWVVPHQANLRVIEAVARRMEVPIGKFLINIDRYGNTSAATVPTALDEAVRAGKIDSGDLLLLNAFGAGSTWGSLLLRW